MEQRYRILRPLESGADLRVYLAMDTWEDGREKVLTLMGKPEEYIGETLGELEDILSKRTALEKDHLIELSDVWSRGKRVGLVSPLLAWPPGLHDFPDNGLRFAAELAELLCDVHAHNYFLGTLSPGVFYCSPSGEWTLNHLLPSRLMMKGDSPLHVRYSAPEYLISKVETRAADLYSFGMILYRLLAGVGPFQGTEVEGLRQKKLFSTPIRPRKINPDLPSRLEDLIIDLTQREPRLRPDSAEYALRVLGNWPSRAKAAAEGRTPLVGRIEEKQQFRRVLDQFLENPERTQFVILQGPGGIGKTRLAEHFELMAQLRGFRTLSVVNLRGEGPLTGFRRLLEKLWNGEPSFARRSGLEKFGEAVLETLELYAQGKPILLRIEDLQWMEEAAPEMLRKLECKKGLRLLVVGTCVRRISEVAKTNEEDHSVRVGFTIIEICPLTLPDIGSFLLDRFGQTLPQDSLALVHRYSGGIPLYVEEIVNLCSDGNFARLRTKEFDFNEGVLSSGIEEIVERRLVGLQASYRRVLMWIAFFHKPLGIETLAELALISKEASFDLAKELSAIGLIKLIGTLAETVLELSPELMRDVIQSQNREVTASVHREICCALERQYSRSGDESLLEDLVRHSWLSDDAAVPEDRYFWAAVDFLEKAGEFAKAGELYYSAFQRGTITSSSVSIGIKALRLLYEAGSFDKCASLASHLLNTGVISDRDKSLIHHYVSILELLRGDVPAALLHSKKALSSIGREDPLLARNLLSQLLCGLSQSGKKEEARATRQQLLNVSRGRGMQFDSKLHHALCLFEQFVEGSFDKAIGHEYQAIHLSREEGHVLQTAGRILHLAVLMTEVGKFDKVAGYLDYAEQLASRLSNLQFRLFSDTVRSVVLRKTGSHREALGLLEELLVLVRAGSGNKHLEIEILSEIGKNLVDLLLPSSATERFLVAAKHLEKYPILGSQNDLTLATGWAQQLFGEPSVRRPSRVSPPSDWIPSEKGRYYLLQGHSALMSGKVEDAWVQARRAERLFPKYMDYYRVRYLFLQGEVLLKKGDTQSAAERIQEGLSLARKNSYLPLQMRGYALLGKCLADRGQPSQGRTYCLRALQLSRHLERPGWKAEVLRILAETEAKLGNQDQARLRYGEALQILKERAQYLSGEQLEAFQNKFLSPLETARRRLNRGGPVPSPRYIQGLTRFIRSVDSAQDLRVLASRLIELVANLMPDCSSNFLIEDADGRVQIVESRGVCRNSGRQLFPKNGASPIEFTKMEGTPTRYQLRLYFQAVAGTRCALYLETEQARFSEEDMDLMDALIALFAFVAPRHPKTPEEPRRNPGLALKDGRQIIGNHPRMKKLFQDIASVAPARLTVLIIGESGTGKELVAQALHDLSHRAKGPFVPVNCSAIPPHLVESELFGHLRGSFTGANRDRPGLFEAASGGTIFLDEISSMPLDLQPRLLRVLETRKVRRVGDVRERPVDVRVVAAANQRLEELVRKGHFRGDLYHRLNVYLLDLPPLRERASDIGILAEHFLDQLNRAGGAAKSFASDVKGPMASYQFPGNVRELKNIVESAYYLSRESLITSQEIERRLDPDGGGGLSDATNRIRRLFEDLAGGRANFWTDVRDPFLNRDLSRREVREIISLGLALNDGNYSKLLEYFRLPKKDYRRWMGFLANHDCRVDFRPFRPGVAP